MIEIRPLMELNTDDLRRVITGYCSTEYYRVSVEETDEKTTFNLHLEPLSEPHQNDFQPYLDEETIMRYENAIEFNISLGAFSGGQMVAVAIAEPESWNRSLWIWEFHVAEGWQGQGIGTLLLDALAEKARAAGLRIMVAETQNTNVKAIQFYRKLGFRIEGVDISYYSNQDMESGREVAIFMKRRLV